MKNISVIALFTIATAAQQPALAQTPRESGSSSAMSREVRHELAMLPYYSIFDNLEYRISGGVVTLEGQVTRPTLKSDAENAVKGIEGWTRVVNNIEVLPLSPSDDRLRLAVYYALFGQNSPLTRYAMGALPPVHIIVKNGNVTLKGIVDDEGDKTIATAFANKVSGILSVTNDLTVVKKPG